MSKFSVSAAGVAGAVKGVGAARGACLESAAAYASRSSNAVGSTDGAGTSSVTVMNESVTRIVQGFAATVEKLEVAARLAADTVGDVDRRSARVFDPNPQLQVLGGARR